MTHWTRIPHLRSGALIFLCLAFASSIKAQDLRKVDSINNELTKLDVQNKNNPLNDTLKVDLLYALSREYWSCDENKGMDYARQIMAVAEKTGYKRGVCLAWRSMGYVKTYHANYAESIEYFLKSLKVAEEMGNKELICGNLNYIGLVYNNKGDYKQALKYLQKSLRIAREIKEKKLLPNILNNIGNSLNSLEENAKAMACYQQAFKLAEQENNLRQMAVCLMGVGEIYGKEKNYVMSLQVHLKSLRIAEEVHDKNTFSHCLKYVGIDYYKLGNTEEALQYLTKALAIAAEINAMDIEKEIYGLMQEIYLKKHDYKSAFEYMVMFDKVNDSVYNTLRNEKISHLEMQYDLEKREVQRKGLQDKKDTALREELKKQKYIRYASMIGITGVLLFSIVVLRQKKKIGKAKKRSDELLLNILPYEVAAELKSTGSAKAKNYERVTVMFTDFKQFTHKAERMSAEELVKELDYCFSNFDEIIQKHGIEKIKTIGDAYMCAGGLPEKNSTNPEDVVRAGIEIRNFMRIHNKKKIADGEIPFEIRIGINTGSVVAGIVGVKKFAYDIWGDSVNMASRIESAGEVGKINISGSTYDLVKDKFQCSYRGKVATKNKGEMDMYFVEDFE